MPDENPLAFPGQQFQPGMTLRDYFAGQAAPGMIDAVNHSPALIGRSGDELSAIAARLCYGFADAMLAERKTGQ